MDLTTFVCNTCPTLHLTGLRYRFCTIKASQHQVFLPEEVREAIDRSRLLEEKPRKDSERDVCGPDGQQEDTTRDMRIC